MSLLDFVARCNTHDLSGFVPWRIGETVVGWMPRRLVGPLPGAPGVFRVSDSGILLDSGLTTGSDRTGAVARLLDRLIADGDVPPRRNEDYPVVTTWGQPSLMRVDRAHVPLLGVLAFGLHVNGYVRVDGGVEMWLARRATDRMVEPGKLDNMVGGGQPAGLSLARNLAKEAEEEAGIGAGLIAGAKPAGAITYTVERDRGLKRDVLFSYDLEVPSDFEPVNRDGEVAAFERWPVGEVVERLRRDGAAFKFNVPLVIIDFLIRQGLVDPDTEPDYVALVRGLRGLGGMAAAD